MTVSACIIGSCVKILAGGITDSCGLITLGVVAASRARLDIIGAVSVYLATGTAQKLGTVGTTGTTGMTTTVVVDDKITATVVTGSGGTARAGSGRLGCHSFDERQRADTCSDCTECSGCESQVDRVRDSGRRWEGQNRYNRHNPYHRHNPLLYRLAAQRLRGY